MAAKERQFCTAGEIVLRLLRLFAANPSEETRQENIAARSLKMRKVKKASSSPAFNFLRLLRLFAASPSEKHRQ